MSEEHKEGQKLSRKGQNEGEQTILLDIHEMNEI